METVIANAVVENENGLYVPPFLKRGTFVFFAIDNTDFAEDTVIGKGTTYDTITAVYLKADEPTAPNLELALAGGCTKIAIDIIDVTGIGNECN